MNDTFTNHPIFAHRAVDIGRPRREPGFEPAREPGRGALRALFLSGLLVMALAAEDGAYRSKEANAAELQGEAAAPGLAGELDASGAEAEAPAGEAGSALDREAQLSVLADSARAKLERVVRRPVLRGRIYSERALVTPTLGDVERELACLALNVYFEARSEPERGKFAVAHVVMNRVADGRFPDTVCTVVKQGGERVRHRCQFSWWCDGQSDTPRNAKAWAESQAIAAEVFWGRDQDPTKGALWYHADYVKPYWRTAFQKGPTIGRHLFYQRKGPAVQVASTS